MKGRSPFIDSSYRWDENHYVWPNQSYFSSGKERILWERPWPCTSTVLNFLLLFFQLFRDCLRLVRHISPGHSPKAQALRHTVRSQFDANRAVEDPVQLENLKANAVRALSNYMLYQSAQSEPKLNKAMKDQVEKAKKDGDLDPQKWFLGEDALRYVMLSWSCKVFVGLAPSTRMPKLLLVRTR